VKNIRHQVADAAAFLDWLHTRGLTLAACAQADLDQWLASKPGSATRSANFARWATTHHHAPRLTAPTTRWTGPAGPLDQDRRWADARRLLHDDTCPTIDRVAGLLILLYAQKLNVISTLTTQHVRHTEGHTLLALGSRSIVLPAPLDRLVNELADTTRQTPGSGLIDVSEFLPVGLTPDAGRDTHSPKTPSPDDSARTGCNHAKAATPRYSCSLPRSRPRSWPRRWAFTSKPPSNGSRSPAATGLPTPPKSAAVLTGREQLSIHEPRTSRS
jgi:hypothetical protein